MLAILHHLEPDTSIPLGELSELVGISPAELADDITALSMCGLDPYDPGSLVEVFVDDDMVHVLAPLPALQRAVRLSAAEARALATALQTAGLGPSDSLTSRLLDSVATGFSAEELAQMIRSAVTESARGVYQTLALGIERSDVVRIIYRRSGAQEDTERDIEPVALLNDRGAWYVSAFCRLAGAPRTFRLDRVREATSTGSSFTPRYDSADSRAFVPEGLPLAMLRFEVAGEYSKREWPGSSVVREMEKDLEVEVPYSGTAWISRMVTARLGSVEAIEPAEVRSAVRSLAEALAHPLDKIR